jgi:hypothetical protein
MIDGKIGSRDWEEDHGNLNTEFSKRISYRYMYVQLFYDVVSIDEAI